MLFLTSILSLLNGIYLKKIMSFFKTCELNHKNMTNFTTEAEFILIYFISLYFSLYTYIYTYIYIRITELSQNAGIVLDNQVRAIYLKLKTLQQKD